MKRIGFAVILLFMTLSIFAQQQIVGKVKNASGELLIGANVFIKDLNKGVSTNANGIFTFNNITPKTYTFVVSYVGYKSLETMISKENQKNLEFVLDVNNIVSEEVIVTATRAGSKTPMAITNMGINEITKNNTGSDVPYLLSTIPSLVETSESGIGIGYTSMRIRGIDPTRINVTINGIPYNDAESQGAYWVNLPDFASSVQDIQVQRGVGSSTNGAGAFGATVNLRTKMVHHDPYTELNTSYGSFNTFKSNVQVGTGLINDHFSFDARLSKVQTDGYVDYSFSDHESFFVSGTYYSNKNLIKANVFRGKERTGISWWGVPEELLEVDRTYNPAGQYTDFAGNEKYYKDQTDNYTQTHYQLLMSHEFSKKLNLNFALHYTKGEGYYEQYKESDDFADYNLSNINIGDTVLFIGSQALVFPDSTIASSDIIRRKWMDNDFYGFTYSLNYDLNKLDITIGGSWNKYDGDHYGTILWSEFGNNFAKDHEWYTNNGTKTDFNVFGKATYSLLSNLYLYGDIQYRTLSYKMTGFDDDFKDLTQSHHYDFINPKAGIFYDINQNLSSYFSIAIANREPTRSDFKNAIGDASAMPKHETLYDFELGGHYKSSNYFLSVNLYYMKYKDQLVNTGELSNVGYAIQTNVEDSYRAGIEIMSNYKLNDFLNWQLNLTLSSNKINNFIEYSTYYDTTWSDIGNLPRKLGTTNISYSPAIIGSNTILLKPFKLFEISLISKYVGKQYFDNTSSTDRMLNPYFINNLKLSYTPKIKFAKNIIVFLQVNNLFNVEYESNAYGGNWYENVADPNSYVEQGQEGSWAYYYPQAGINFLGGISIRL